MRPGTPALILTLVCPLGTAAQTASLTLSAPPISPPGQPITVTVDYAADIHETQRRGVMVLEVLDASDQSTLITLSDDNGLQGFEGPSGSVEFEVSVPQPEPDAVCFRAYLTPYGLNEEVQAHLETYPTDGTYPYEWTGTGITQDLYYLGVKILSNTSGNSTHCSGITFETFLLTYENHLATQGLDPTIDGLTVSSIETFRKVWYGVTDYEHQSTLAIETWDLGFRLDDLEDARPGDFIQLWRHSGSGHSCIFQGWGRDDQDQINRLYHWSSQGSTDGIGFNDEKVGATSGVDPDRIHLARVMRPRGPDDWGLRFGDTDTLDSPTLIGEPGVAHGLALR
ncbi:hypothetical protein JXA47_05505 [Candidatus Sumerlaeota bacterium]|nr:hypothetical protein [Candidatus Sumerlaeota bacterium]